MFKNTNGKTCHLEQTSNRDNCTRKNEFAENLFFFAFKMTDFDEI